VFVRTYSVLPSGLTAASTGDELLGSRTAVPTLSEGPEPMFTGTTVPETVRQLGDETPLTTYAVLPSGFIARATGVGGIAGAGLRSRWRVATSITAILPGATVWRGSVRDA